MQQITATGPSSEDCGTGKDGVWVTSRSRDCGKASGRALVPAKDKTLQDNCSHRGEREDLAHGVGGDTEG